MRVLLVLALVSGAAWACCGKHEEEPDADLHTRAPEDVMTLVIRACLEPEVLERFEAFDDCTAHHAWFASSVILNMIDQMLETRIKRATE